MMHERLKQCGMLACGASIIAVAFYSMPNKPKAVAASGQVSSQTMPATATITANRPVQTVGGVSVVPQSGTSPLYGIAAMSATSGMSPDVVKYGDYACEFDGVPTPGNTAVPLDGMCHDSGVANDIGISNLVGVVGKIMKMRPDLGPNFAEVTIGFPGRRGSMVSAGSFAPDVAAYIQANQTPPNAGTVTGVTGTAPIVSSGGAAPAISCPSCVTSQNVTYYSLAGAVLTGTKRIPFTVTTAANGTWSVNYSAVGCAVVRTWNVSVISPSGALATQQYTPYVQVANTTTMSGTVYSGAVLSLLGATIVPITVATTLTGEMVCS